MMIIAIRRLSLRQLDLNGAKYTQPIAMVETTPPINRIATETDDLSILAIAKAVTIETKISNSLFGTPYKNVHRCNEMLVEAIKDGNRIISQTSFQLGQEKESNTKNQRLFLQTPSRNSTD